TNGKRYLAKNPMTGKDMVAFIDSDYEPYGPGEAGHNVNTDLIVDIKGNSAHYSGQLMYLRSVPDPEPEGGYPERPLRETRHLGTVTVTGTGFYEADLEKRNGKWVIIMMNAVVDLPWVFPREGAFQGGARFIGKTA